MGSQFIWLISSLDTPGTNYSICYLSISTATHATKLMMSFLSELCPQCDLKGKGARFVCCQSKITWVTGSTWTKWPPPYAESHFSVDTIQIADNTLLIVGVLSMSLTSSVYFIVFHLFTFLTQVEWPPSTFTSFYVCSSSPLMIRHGLHCIVLLFGIPELLCIDHLWLEVAAHRLGNGSDFSTQMYS